MEPFHVVGWSYRRVPGLTKSWKLPHQTIVWFQDTAIISLLTQTRTLYPHTGKERVHSLVNHAQVLWQGAWYPNTLIFSQATRNAAEVKGLTQFLFPRASQPSSQIVASRNTAPRKKSLDLNDSVINLQTSLYNSKAQIPLLKKRKRTFYLLLVTLLLP